MVIGSPHIEGHLDFRIPFARLQELFYQVVVEGVSYGVSPGGKPLRIGGKSPYQKKMLTSGTKGKRMVLDRATVVPLRFLRFLLCHSRPGVGGGI